MTTDTVASGNQRRMMPQVVILGPTSPLTDNIEPPSAPRPASLGTLGPGGRSIVLDAARSTTPADLALGKFTERVRTIPEVAAIAHAVEGAIQRVWTFITRRDKAVRRRVYMEELALLEECLDLQFDFNVVSIEDAPSRGLVPDDLQGRIVFYRDDRLPRAAVTDA